MFLVVSQSCAAPKGGGPEGWGVGSPKLCAFFPLPPHFCSFCLSLGSSRGILVVFEAPFGVLGLSCEAPAAPETDKKSKNAVGEGKNSAKFWASHPSGPHSSGPHSSGPRWKLSGGRWGERTKQNTQHTQQHTTTHNNTTNNSKKKSKQ